MAFSHFSISYEEKYSLLSISSHEFVKNADRFMGINCLMGCHLACYLSENGLFGINIQMGTEKKTILEMDAFASKLAIGQQCSYARNLYSGGFFTRRHAWP